MVTEGQFLGSCGDQGYDIEDPAKVEEIVNWPRPITVIEVRSFPSMAGYYKRFMEGFSQLALPSTR